jgi:hypothetical protein
LLNGVQSAVGAKAFDGDDVRAVELKEELDAGVEGEVLNADCGLRIAKGLRGWGRESFSTGEYAYH